MELDMPKLKEGVAELAEKHHLNLIILFGSQAKGTAHSMSDVDIAFYAPYRMRPIDIAKMQMDFSATLQIKDIELVDLKSAPPLLLRQIADHSRLLYEKENSLFANFKIYAYKLYMEAKPLLDLRQSKLDAFLKNL